MREYLLCHCNQNNECNIMGIFTNRKKVFEAMQQIGIDNCFIKGIRKNIPLNLSSFAANITDKIVIYKDNGGETKVEFKILEVHPNLFNINLKNKYPYIDEKMFG